MARSRARARLNWVSQGQRWGRCRVRRRAERVIRPAREKNRRRRVLVVTTCSPRPVRAVQRARLCALRTIFNLTDIYRADTDKEVQGFGQHQAVKVDSVDQLLEESDQQMRKMINQVLSDRTLDKYPATRIQQAASQTLLSIEVERIVWPPARREQKELLQFLVDNRYAGALSGTIYVTNSRRPVQ